MSANLERRYARLLRLYPAEYRRTRGPELLATLLEAADENQRKLPMREGAALILGALRAHAGRDRRQSLQHSWLVAFRAAALMLLVHDIASRAMAMTLDVSYGGPSIWSSRQWILNVVAVALGSFAVGAALWGWYRSAIATAGLAFAVTLTVSPAVPGEFWGFPLAIVLLAPLVWRRPPAAAGLTRYAPALALLMALADQGLAQVFPGVAGILTRGLVLAVCLGALLWLAVDERLAMALGLLLLNTLLIRLALGAFTVVAVTCLLPAVLLLASSATARKSADI